MPFSQKGSLDDLDQIGARMRAGLADAGELCGKTIVKRAHDGIVQGTKSGVTYPGHNQSSAPGEYSANQTGKLLGSIKHRMSGHNFLTIYATADHAGFQEYGTSRMGARPNLKLAIDESDGIVRNIIEQIMWRALRGGK